MAKKHAAHADDEPVAKETETPTPRETTDAEEPVKQAKKSGAHHDEIVGQDMDERPAVREQEPGKAYEGRATLELLETTDAEDIDLLAQAIVALIQDPAYDDMTWPEIDRALRLTSHQIKQNWSATGSVKTPPPPDPPEGGELTRMEGESDEDYASRRRAVHARHASGLKSDPRETARAKYAG